MKTKIKLILLIISILISSKTMGQNLLTNGDFESDGGSLTGWEHPTLNAEVGDNGGNHYARIYGENGVLYQRITGLTPGKSYECTINFLICTPKQTSGFGYAIEKSTPLIIPSFTTGATQLKPFCENNSGLWTNLTVSETNVQKKFSVVIPADASAIYICLGTKGAVANFTTTDVILEEKQAYSLSFFVKSKNTGLPLQNAFILVPELTSAAVTNASGIATLKLIPRELPYDVTVRSDWYKTQTFKLAVNGPLAQTEVLLDTIVEIKKVETRISKYGDNATPYPLYGHLWNSGLTYSEEVANKLTSGFDYITGGSLPTNLETTNLLRQKDTKFQIIRYSGGWSSSYSYAESSKSSLAYYRAGSLAAAIDQSTTTFTINTPPSSKGKGFLASESGKFDIWIRIENELMKIVSVSSNTTYPITVTVERGFEGTIPTNHAAGKTVTLPLYGGTPPVAGQASTNRNYFITCYGLRKEKLDEAINDAVLKENFDGIWIDILIGKLDAVSLFNNGYEEWDFNTESVLSATNEVKYTKNAIKQLYEKFYSQNGYFPIIYGNNVLYSQSLNASARGYAMVKTSEHPKVIDGFCHENSWGHMTDVSGTVDNDGNPIPTADVFKVVGSNNHFLEWYMGSTWIDNCKAISLLAQQNLPNQPMTINAGFKNQWFATDLTDEVRYAFNKYAYASYLMCINVTADSLISCRMGISPMVLKNGVTNLNVEPFFYYPVGIPTQSLSYASFSGYRYNTSNLYRRKFTQGIVLVNPFGTDMNSVLNIADVAGDNRTYIDPENNNAVVTTVNLKSRESKILLTNVMTRVDKTPVSQQDFTVLRKTDNIYILKLASGFITDVSQFVSVYNSSGQLVYKTNLVKEKEEYVLDLKSCPGGVYLVKADKLKTVLKFIRH